MFGQAMVGSLMPVHVVLGGLAGAFLAENRALATLPISVVVLTSMFTAPVASLFMGRFGRRPGFLCGAAAGAVGALLAMRALFAQSFGMLVGGSACIGIAQSFLAFYRFAAADQVPADLKPKAIAWVMAGGLMSALIGPEIVRVAGDGLAPVPYAGAYAAVAVAIALGAAGLVFLEIPTPVRPEPGARAGRSLSRIFREPKVIGAVVCAMVSYAVMSLVMTSTPLAMVAVGFTSDHAADVVRWHVVAMFAPSFVTGHVIARFGHLRVIATGLVLLGACAAIASTGVDIRRFYVALVALGVGWNFGFIGATSLLATTHTAEEQARVQGLNDFLVFGLVATASFSSGALLNGFGWSAVQLAAIPALGVAVVALIWLGIDSGHDPLGARR